MSAASRHDGTVRGYHRMARAWYASAVQTVGEPDRITVGQYALEGGTTGEYSIVWIELSGRLVPRLEAFDDAWEVLAMHRDLIEALAKVDNWKLSPDEFERLLQRLGFKDLTARVNPNPPRVVHLPAEDTEGGAL